MWGEGVGATIPYQWVLEELALMVWDLSNPFEIMNPSVKAEVLGIMGGMLSMKREHFAKNEMKHFRQTIHHHQNGVE